MTEDNTTYCHGGMAEYDKAYCQSGMAGGNTAYPHDGEAKYEATYCHGGAAKDNAGAIPTMSLAPEEMPRLWQMPWHSLQKGRLHLFVWRRLWQQWWW
jgi:hypothetical protein